MLPANLQVVMSTQLDEVADALESVRLNGNIPGFARQQYLDVGEPDIVRDYSEVLETIDTVVALIEAVEQSPSEGHISEQLCEQVGMLRCHARQKYSRGVLPTALQQSAKALTEWDNGNKVDLEAVRHNLAQVRTATKTVQEAHEWLAQNTEARLG